MNSRDWRYLPPAWNVREPEYLHPFWCLALMLVGGAVIFVSDKRLADTYNPLTGCMLLLLSFGVVCLPWAWLMGRKTQPRFARVARWAPVVFAASANAAIWWYV